jgi:hypothetical protein
MGILSLFKSKRKIPVLFRCTHCYYECDLSLREVLLLAKKNAHDPVCPLKEECDICHIGFLIPVKFTDKLGNEYLFHKIKPTIKNLDPSTVMDRILNHDHSLFTVFIDPYDKL